MSYSCTVTIYGLDYGSYWVFDYATETCWSYDDGSGYVTGGTGGGSDVVPPTLPPPGLNKACSDANNSAGKELKPTMAASNSENREYAGFVYKSDATGELFTSPPMALQFNTDSRTAYLGDPLPFAGYTAIAWYHTHPGYGNFANDDIDTSTNIHFSQEDLNYSAGLNLEAYVAVDHYVNDSFRVPTLYHATAAGSENNVGPPAEYRLLRDG